MPDPRQLTFWTAEEAAFWDELAPLLLSIIFKGGTSGEALLPAGLRVLVDWDAFNRGAVQFLNDYRLNWISGITDTSRNQTVAAIDEWIRSGESLDVLEARLAPIYGASRAENIAVTEVTRIYAKGNELAWGSTGLVGGKRWNTANDEKVCPICGPLDGQIVGLANGFMGGLRIAVPHPPAHPRCRCWETPVVSEELLREQIRGILS